MRTILSRVKRALRIRTRYHSARRWVVRYRWGWLIVHDQWVDRRFGASCGGVVPSPFEAQGATRTESASYRTLAKLFGHPLLRVGPSDVLVDVGCGKGRVINYWLFSGCRNRIVGIERTPQVGKWTRTRLADFDNVEILIGDACEVLPADGTVFFLFNPFGRETMKAFASQLLMRVNMRSVRILYLNARHVDVFDRLTWDIRELDSDSPDAAVLIRHVHGVTT